MMVYSYGRRVRRGFTLLELTVVLGIIALMAAAIMLFFGNASDSQKADDLEQEIIAVVQVSKSLYAGSTPYVGLNTALVAGAKQLPAKWSSGGALFNPYGGYFGVATFAGSYPALINLNIQGISRTACMRIATSMTLDTAASNINVNGLYDSGGQPYTQALANTYCNNSSGGANTIGLNFY